MGWGVEFSNFLGVFWDMGVSTKKKRYPPKSSISNRVFHYKPSILGYTHFWKHPYTNIIIYIIFFFKYFSLSVKYRG